LEPEEVVLTLFKHLFKRDEEQNLSVAPIEQFFGEHGYHLTEDEAQEFLQDIRCLLDDGGSMKLKEFAYMMRDAVESLPR
jgi:Ca2+-binding EF-hand superfamily protein